MAPSNSIIVSDGSDAVTHNGFVPLSSDTPRVVKFATQAQPWEVAGEAVSVSAKAALVLTVPELGDIRFAGYRGEKEVPEALNRPYAMLCIEMLEINKKQQLYVHAVTEEGTFGPSKKKKAAECDLVHLWPINKASLDRMRDNFENDVYADLSNSRKKKFADFFKQSEEVETPVGINAMLKDPMETLPNGCKIADAAYAGIQESNRTMGMRMFPKEKKKREDDEKEAMLEDANKKAKLVDWIQEMKSGEVTIALNILGADGKQAIFTGKRI